MYFFHEFGLRRKPVLNHDKRLFEIQFYVQTGSARLCDGRALQRVAVGKSLFAFKAVSSEPVYWHAVGRISCRVASY